jgi:N-acetylglutamate synthase-like GNAT family acetyltransferase
LDDFKNTQFLCIIYVVPEKRNCGVGSELVKEAENRARTIGYNLLYLFTPNKAAWYSKLGWETIELSCLNGTPITIMHKQLVTE